jgi:hypothetical protein
MDVGARYLDTMRLSSGAGVVNGNNILRYGGELRAASAMLQIKRRLKKLRTGYLHSCLQSTQIQKNVPLESGKTLFVCPPEQPEPTMLWNAHMQLAEGGHASCGTYAPRLLASSGITRRNSLLASAVANSQGVRGFLHEMMM